MPIYELNSSNIFPNPELSQKDGLLAIGGDLSPERLIEAYKKGIFPWYGEGYPILWWSPDPRMILYPDKLKVSKSLRKRIISNEFTVKYDINFEEVIKACANIPRKDQNGETWITNEMISAYIDLHKLGIAHSVETYIENKLVGGLYGLSIGACFFGESMFHKITDASKVALYFLVKKVKELGIDFIDVQQETNHLGSLGAISINRKEFLLLLSRSIKKDVKTGSWT